MAPSSDSGRRNVVRLPAAAIRRTGWGTAGTSWISLGIFHVGALMEARARAQENSGLHARQILECTPGERRIANLHHQGTAETGKDI